MKLYSIFKGKHSCANIALLTRKITLGVIVMLFDWRSYNFQMKFMA